jgi:membrane protein required for colicin V production
MAWIDWIILLVLAGSVMGGFSQGFFRSVFSMGGMFFGLLLAAWNYDHAAALFLPIVRFEAAADTLGFLLIVFVVTAIANCMGWLLSRTVHSIGLGCLDRLLGAGFGLLQGWLLVTLVILVALAFFPGAHWLSEGRMPHLFFGACHLSTHMSPAELAGRVSDGLRMLEEQSPDWMHPRG